MQDLLLRLETMWTGLLQKQTTLTVLVAEITIRITLQPYLSRTMALPKVVDVKNMLSSIIVLIVDDHYDFLQ